MNEPSAITRRSALTLGGASALALGTSALTELAHAAAPIAARAPGSFSVTGQSSSTISLAWTASTRPAGAPAVTQYRIYSGTTQLAAVAPATSATLTGLAPNTVYSLTIKAYNGSLSAASNVATGTTNPASWALHYSTEFTNLNGWTIENLATQNNDNSINLAANVVAASLGGGKGLTIYGRRDAAYAPLYTSGEILGKGAAMVVPNYFRAEVIGTSMDVKGLWPCLLWFRPMAGGDGSNGEIDVMEYFGGNFSDNERRVAVTMHNEYGVTQDSWKGPIYWSDLTNPSITAEHKYTLEKTPGMIKVWMDNDVSKAAYFGTTAEVLSHLPQNGVATPKAWWNRIMEAQDRTWYPRITLQVGTGSVTAAVQEPPHSCAVGAPPCWDESKMTVKSLKLWKLV